MPAIRHAAAFRAIALPVWTVLCVVLATAVLVKLRLGVPWHYIMGDPASTVGWPFYTGFVSNIGAMLWAATASIFLFRYYVHHSGRGEADWGRFLLASGLFAGLLGLDDLFMLHEQALPDYLSISQTLVVGAYGVITMLYLWRFAPQLMRTAWPLFLVAVGMLTFSVGLDQLMDHLKVYPPASGFLEDAAKLMGIGTWLSYAVHTCALPQPGADEWQERPAPSRQ